MYLGGQTQAMSVPAELVDQIRNEPGVSIPDDLDLPARQMNLTVAVYPFELNSIWLLQEV